MSSATANPRPAAARHRAGTALGCGRGLRGHPRLPSAYIGVRSTSIRAACGFQGPRGGLVYRAGDRPLPRSAFAAEAWSAALEPRALKRSRWWTGSRRGPAERVSASDKETGECQRSWRERSTRLRPSERTRAAGPLRLPGTTIQENESTSGFGPGAELAENSKSRAATVSSRT